jgi:hypothetical protein
VIDVLLVWVGVVDSPATVEVDPTVTELGPELEEPHAARINTTATTAITHAAGLRAPRGCRRQRVR